MGRAPNLPVENTAGQALQVFRIYRTHGKRLHYVLCAYYEDVGIVVLRRTGSHQKYELPLELFQEFFESQPIPLPTV